MRTLFATVFAVLLAAATALAPAARADEFDSGTAAAIRSVIENQMAAFKVDDGPAAFAYASPTIQELFQTPEIFMSMVKTGYPSVYRPQEIEFLELTQEARGPVQVVHIVGADGSAVLALYSMEQQSDGSWRIDGCTLTAAPDVGI